MRERPLSVTIVAWLFIAAGAVGIAYHASDLWRHAALDFEAVWLCLIRLAAIISGIFLLRGRNWARWLAVVWMAYHVILSAFHTVGEMAAHAVLLAVIAFFLFRRTAAPFFRRAA